MNIVDARNAAQVLGDHDGLSWSGDNARFVVEELLPILRPPADIVRVIRWAYGYDGAGASFEHRSDGSTAVPDLFMAGVIKEPYGVAHDWLCMLHNCRKPDPAGHRWGYMEHHYWYCRALRAFGYPVRAWIRFAGLLVFNEPFERLGKWWRKWRRKENKC